MKKKKLLSVLMFPLLLSGCASIPVTEKAMTDSVAMESIKRSVQTNTSIAYDGSGGGTGTNYQSTGYPSVYGYETHTTTEFQTSSSSLTKPGNVYGYHDCGVKIYANNTSTSVGSSTTIRINNSSPYIDFTEANWMMPGTYQNQMNPMFTVYALMEFRIEIYKGSSRYFHAGAKVNLSSDDASVESVTYDRYTTTVTDTNCNKDATQGSIIDFSKLGKVASSLYSGDYTVRLTYSYQWFSGDSTKIAFVLTTATATTNLIIDYTKPSISMKSNGSVISSGSYSNAPVTVTASDTHLSGIHYRIPGSSSYGFTSSSSYVTGTTSGWYYFYSVDTNGNRSDEIKVFVDTTKPTGQIYANGKAVASGSYINTSFSYSASDSGAGIKGVYYKTPSSNSFVPYSSGSIIPAGSGDGWYQFYSVDNAGNVSDTVKVFLENEIPVVSIKKNGVTVYTHSINGNETVDTGLYFNVNDTIEFDYDSASDRYTSGAFSVRTRYTLSASGYPNSIYSETITSALGNTVTYQFRIVKTMPYLTLNGTTYSDGADIRLNADADALANIDSVIKDGTNRVSVNGTDYDYFAKRNISLTANEDEVKTYQIEIEDTAGNTSRFTVTIDKQPANGTFSSNGVIIGNNGYTNKPFTFDWNKENTTATVSKDGGVARVYAKEEITEDGQYTFVLTDAVGNTSEFRITKDSVAPIGSIYVDNREAENGVITNKSIYFTWDGSETCRVNGEDYRKNTVIDKEGTYEFVLQDKAGNRSVYQAEIDKTAPVGNEEGLNGNSDYPASKWYEVSFNGSIDCFRDYGSALGFATEREFEANVEVLTLNDVSDFTQTSMVASNGDEDNHDDEVRTGTYWLYKSIANPEIRLYYFDENLLREALNHYSEAYVSGPHYLDGLSKADGAEVASPIWNMDGVDAPIGNDYVLHQFEPGTAYAVKDGTDVKIPLTYGETLGSQLTETGLYEITETDQAGNSCSYLVIIDRERPKVSVHTETYGNDSKDIVLDESTIPTTGTFYLKSFEIRDILDNDPYAVVAVTHDGSTSYYTRDDELPILSEGGKYEIRIYDRLGNENHFTVYISSQEETVTFTNSGDDTSVAIDIALGEPNETITFLEITRNGEKLSGVTPDNLSYVFTKDGNYKVTIRDNFGRTLEYEYYFHKALPEGNLSGVDNGGRTNQDVSFDYDASRYNLVVYKDGKQILTDTSGHVDIHATEDTSGAYELVLINNTDEENRKTYGFVMDTIPPQVELDGVEDHSTTNGSVTVSWEDTDVQSATVSKDGSDPISFSNGDVFDKEGTYTITVVDELGNTTYREFTIDKTVDYEVKTTDGSRIGGDATTSNDVIITAGEEVKITVIKDGSTYPYELGGTLTEEGRYLITVEDGFGNKNSFTIVIDKTVDVEMNVADGGITNGPVTINPGEKANITITKDGEVYGYNPGDEISEEGIYRVVITDAYGNTEEVSFEIVHADARTSIDYNLGDDVHVTKVTKDGEEIEYDSNHIAFYEDGTYEVFYEKDGMEYSFRLTLDTTAPEITLTGVDDGGKVDGSVTVSDMTEPGTVQVYKDGEEIPYTLGDELREYGSYRVVVTDSLGNQRIYTFTLAFQMNGWAIALISIGVLSALGGSAFIVLKRKRVFKK